LQIATRAAGVGLALLSVVNVLNYFDRLLMTVAAEPVKKAFALSDTQLSVLTGPAFVLVYVSASLLFGWLADRRNRRNVMALAVALWSFMTVLGGLAQRFSQLAIARAGVGLGEGGSNPASLSMISSYFGPELRGRAVAVFQASGMIGILLTFVVGSWLVTAFGWRAAFLVAGLPGLLCSLALLAWVREPGRGQPGTAAQIPSLRASLGLLRANAPYRWIVFASGLAVFGNLGMMQWLPLFFMRSHHLSLHQMGLFFGPGLACGMMAGMLIGGWIGDRLGRTGLARSLLLCVVANLILTPLDWLVLWVPSTRTALVLTFFASAMSVVFAPTLTAAMQTVAGVQVRGMAAAVFNLVNGVLGQALFPFLVGVLSDAFHPSHGEESLRMALTFVIGICLVAAAVFVKAMRVTERAVAPLRGA
jgi:MFS family permease